jgi:S-DNA-T family DNA segregation ATPase FtsK/SpoIIIE
MSRLAFHRPARFLPPSPPTDKVVLPTPPENQNTQGGAAWVTVLLPLLSAMGMAGYMITFGRPLLIIIGVLFVLVAIGTAVMMRTQMKTQSRQGNRKQRLRYRAHLSSTRRYVRDVALAQRMHSALIHPEPSRLWAIATTYERVWERRPDDPDFLRIRVGVGDADLSTPIQVGNKLDPMAEYDWESLRAAQRLANRMGRVSGQPAVVDLGACGVVSVLGRSEQAAALIRAMLCQVVVLHAPDNVSIALEASGPGDWEWVKWLPHAIEENAAGPAGVVPLVAADPEGLTDFLEQELSRRQDLTLQRRAQIGIDRSTPTPLKRLIVVFTGFAPVSEWGRSNLFRGLLDAAGPQYGLTLVFLTEWEGDEPGRVDLRLHVGADSRLAIEGKAKLRAAVERCVPDAVEVSLAELIARRMAPLRLTDEQEQVLTRTISLTEMLVAGNLLTFDITSRWAQAVGERLLRVPIGSDGDGEPVILDIKESAQNGFGPHGLIVGATGSGKSELLRTLVTGLALTHSPEVLSFVLIDFKGGATFAPMTELPHVAGLITNLADDAAMIDRVQAALMGEQQRRQQMLRAAGNVDSIREYQRRQVSGAQGATGAPLEPMPYLVIIVDEFSELLSGRPEFVDLFVQIGRVGRSLGLHLLMASQRLEEGRLRGLDSHLSYRICLRTFSAIESRTVIGTTDAYRLPPVPGSAYLKVDESRYVRFRVAHVSSPFVSDDISGVPGSAIVPFDGWRPVPGAPDQAETILPTETDDADPGPTELAVVVGRLKTVGRPAHQVWLPPLPAAIPLDYLTGMPTIRPGRGLMTQAWPHSADLKIPIGVLDLPLQQQQQPLTMDFGGPHGNLAVVGAPQTGRSTTLRTVMLAGMLTHTPAEMQFYCIDFGGGSLHQYLVAPHVGSVAGRTDEVLIRRTLAELRSAIVEREALFREAGIVSVGEFRARRSAGLLPDGMRAADLFLIIDNWGGVRSEYEDAEAQVADIAARGLGVGVHLLLTTSRWTEIRPLLRDSIGTRIELRLNDPTESEVNRRLAAQLAHAVPGRGIAAPGAYFHLVLPRLDGRETADGVFEAQEDILAKITASWSGPGAPAVRVLPERLGVAELRELAAGRAEGQSGVPVGVAEADLAPVLLDVVGGEPHVIVFGDTGSGKTEFMRTFIDGLAATRSAWDARIVVVDYRRSLLGEVPNDYLGAYAADADATRFYVEQICEKLAERLPPADITPQALAARDWWEGPEIYVLADDYDLVGGSASAPMGRLVEYLPHAREVGLHLVLTRKVSGLGRAFGDQLLMRIQEMGCTGIVLSGDKREGIVIGDERAAPRPPGRGVLVRRGHPGELVQIALLERAEETANR